jgi:hypothetical protein
MIAGRAMVSGCLLRSGWPYRRDRGVIDPGSYRRRPCDPIALRQLFTGSEK